MSWFKENGFLSDEGKRIVADFKLALDNILSRDDIMEMSFAELQVLSSNLQKMVGDEISNKLVSRLAFVKTLNNMTDEQFKEYLHTKYGSVWELLQLLPEEEQRLKSVNYMGKTSITAEWLAKVAKATTDMDMGEAPPAGKPTGKIISDEFCTGYMWRDEFGNESFKHGEYTSCPIHDVKPQSPAVPKTGAEYWSKPPPKGKLF